MSATECDRLTASIQAIASNPDERAAFILEGVKRSKELQRNNTQDYEAAVSSLLVCLENFDVVHGTSLDIMCELTVLDILLSLDLSAMQLSQCNSYVRLCLVGVPDVTVAAAAAQTFSQTLTFSMTTDFVRTQIEDAMQWIAVTDAKLVPRRVCGLLVLTEVAMRAPMILLPKLNDIFDKLWDGLASKDEVVRSRTLTLFTLCSKLLVNRPLSVRTETYDSLLHHLKSALTSKSHANKVAGLLAFEPIVMNAAPMSIRYEDLSIMLVPFLVGGGNSNTSSDIRELLFRCLVVLCRFSTMLFVTNQLKDTVRFALDSISSGIQRNTAFDMVSEIIPIVGKPQFDPFVTQTCDVITRICNTTKTPCWPALRCLSTVCRVCQPPDMEVFVDSCLESFFHWGLSTALVEGMRDIIAASNEQFRVKLEESLLDLISVTLCGLPFRQQYRTQGLGGMEDKTDPSEGQIAVALNALMQFGFSNSELMGDFLRDSVLPFIDNPSTAVRNASIYTIVKLLIPPGDKGQLSVVRRMCINTVLSRMLVVALSDPNEVIRQTILACFSEAFYPFLSEQQFLIRLCSALGDESVNCQVAVVEQLCRMVNYDPSHILPVLREEIVTVLHLVSSSFNTNTVKDGLRLLTALSSKAPQLVVSFMEGICVALKPYFDSLTSRSVILLPFLHCCTVVSRSFSLFGKQEMVFRDEVLPICRLLDSLPADRTFHAARLTCVRFLSATLNPTVDGESPYRTYPRLFNVLSSIVKRTDDSADIRLEALKCMGVIGALDTHVFQSFGLDADSKAEVDVTRPTFNRVSHQRCCALVLKSIVALMDPGEAHAAPLRDSVVRIGVQTILNITDRCSCARAEIGVVVAPLGRVICAMMGGRLLATVLFEFSNLLTRYGAKAADDKQVVFRVFNAVWTDQRPYRFLAVRLLSILSTFDADQSIQYSSECADILPRMFDTIGRSDTSSELKYAVLEYIIRHAEALQGFCAVVVENLLLTIQTPSTPLDFVQGCLVALNCVCAKLFVNELVGSIVRSLVNCLEQDRIRSGPHSMTLVGAIMNVILTLTVEVQSDFLKHAVYVSRVLKQYRITSNEYTTQQNKLLLGERCVRSTKRMQAQAAEVAALLKKCEALAVKSMARVGEVWSYTNLTQDQHAAAAAVSDAEAALPINEARIVTVIKTVPLTKEEWVKWSTQFTVSLMQESPYQVFRCVSLPIGLNATPLVEKSPDFADAVLQTAFQVVWTYSGAAVRATLVEFLRNAFRQSMMSSTVPDAILTMLLSIVEYMDHVGDEITLTYTDLSECAWSRGMLAKALYWREAAYRQDPEGTVESLISLYSELHMVDSSVGIFNQASDEQRATLLQSSLVKLARYGEALELTQQEIVMDSCASDASSSESFSKPNGYKAARYRNWAGPAHYGAKGDYNGSSSTKEDAAADRRLEITARLMLCLSELGNFDKVLTEWKSLYQRYGQRDNQDMQDGANVLCYASQYAADAAIRLQSWDTLSDVLKWMPQETVFYHIAKASSEIAAARYDAAAVAVVEGRKLLLEDLAGLLNESYARAYEGLVVAQELTEMEEVVMALRIRSSVNTVEHISVISRLWDRRIRTMSPTVLAWKQILGVRGLLIAPKDDVKTRIRFIKLCRQEGSKQLEKFTQEQLLGMSDPTKEQLLSRSANPRVVMQYVTYLSTNNAFGATTPFGEEPDFIKRVIDVHSKAENALVLARAYARLGRKVELEESVACFQSATQYDPKWYLGWRLWAASNVALLAKSPSDEACTNAINGYIRSIQLGTSSSTYIQDILKLLTLWTRYCDSDRGLKELRSRALDVPSYVWHLVLPQLIARLDTGSDESCHLVADILTSVAYDFPHTLVYPLNLCVMSDSERRKRWATVILDKLQSRYPRIVMQGQVMIDELIRVSALIFEQWYDRLEEAASAFFGRGSKEEMTKLLLPMHETLIRTPETIIETEFIAKYGRSLTEAKDWLRSFSTTKNPADVQSAWNLYHTVYRQIDEQIKSSAQLQLQFCSPKLFEARNLAIGIPDARPTQEAAVCKVASFNRTIRVISSKQRPKRISLLMTTGKNMKFLLKGREDLRLDERVMQLFGLVNILMASDARTCENFGFQIQRYSVTPLKDTVGLIGWVDGCDTFQEVVRMYRESRSIVPELEMRMIGQLISFDNAKAYDYLQVMSKVEVMEYLMDRTSGHDLRHSMWSVALNCESWMEQRRMFTASLANMSMVGYILGLGDRHPNNIMMQRASGLVVHIDFGDCFEVAMTRDKFPEKVPFRLTRMLWSALDVSGVEGAFRSKAETAMAVLRENSHSVLALMEAFIQDPLISWRLINRPGQEPESSTEHKTIEEKVTNGNLNNPQNTNLGSVTGSIDGHKGHSVHEVAMHLFGEEVDVVHQGVFIFNRLSSKLKGEDFITSQADIESLDTRTQVGRLIEEATDITNVAQSWSGWYPFW